MIAKIYRAVFLSANHCSKALNMHKLLEAEKPAAKDLEHLLTLMVKVIPLYILSCG